MELILLIRGAVKCRVTSNRRPILASQLVSTGLYCLHAKSQRGIDDVSRARSSVELLLVHPGGPFWKKKDEGAWSIPKGEVSAEEDALDTARREFCEETGIFPEAQFLPLGQILQKGGKVVRA